MDLSRGQPQLTIALVEKAITSPYSKFVADPYRIIDSTQAMHDFQIKKGVMTKPVKLDQPFFTLNFLIRWSGTDVPVGIE